MTNEPVISLDKVSFSYDGAAVLEDVTLTILDKSFTWIVGPNGGGKTTLLKLMLGLLEPASGTVRVFGKKPRAARTRIGYMSQQVSLDRSFPVTVLDVVLMGRLGRGRNLGFFNAADRGAAEKALDLVGLHGQRRRSVSELSGGQQRRLFIARTLASEPDLMLLDEPTANLDLLVQRNLYVLLHQLNERLTVVMVSHDPAFVTESVKQVVCVKRTVSVHPTGEICSDMLAELYGEGALRIIRHDRHFGNGEPDA